MAEVADSSKYLGATITDLSWTNHIQTMPRVAAKGNRTVGFLRRTFRDCTTKVKSTTYTTRVRPTLEYASTAWDPHKQKDAHLLEKVVRIFTKMRADSNERRRRYSVEQQGMLATISETEHPVPLNSCSTVCSETVLNNAGSTTDSRCCTGSTMGWSILTSPNSASAITQIPGQEPSDYIRSIPATLSFPPAL